MLDTNLRFVWVNDALQRLCGIPAERWFGHRFGEVLPGIEAERIESSLLYVLETGRPVTGLEHGGPHLGYPEIDGMWSCMGYRLASSTGEVLGVAYSVTDITERSQYEERVTLLNEASKHIGSTLDVVRTAEELLEVTVPRIGDCANLNLLAYVLDGTAPPRIDQRHQSLRMRRAATRWLPGEPVPESFAEPVMYTDSRTLYHQHLVTGRPIFVPYISKMPDRYFNLLTSEVFRRRIEAVRRAGGHSMMIIPIIARGVVMGTVAFYRMRSKAFTRADLTLAQEVVSRAAISIDNAHAYTRERATALELQHSLLPRRLPHITGLDVTYRYIPANTAAEVGGDWFDIIPRRNGRVALIVGDVTGHDIHAASLMGQLRTATRTLTTFDLSPAQVLAHLDAMTLDAGEEAGATCVYAEYDVTSRRCDIARAGHPLPALVTPGGTVQFLGLPSGLPLGVGGARFESVELHLAPGSMLVLYTDGLIETRTAGIDVGMGRLAHALADSRVAAFDDGAITTLLESMAPEPGDDIAILLAKV